MMKKIAGPQWIVVSKPKGVGLSSREAKEVIDLVRQAKHAGEVPAMSYEYNPHSRFFGKDPVYFQPKTADLRRTAVKLRKVLRKRVGLIYNVRLS